jgi:DNA-binding response OmpR family regulator
VLVVEDEPQMRQVLAWALEDEGLPVQTASDGSEALEVAQAQRPALVVLDMGLPIVDGYGVASGLRTTYGQEVPILVVTADGRAAEKARRVGAYSYLSKPFDLSDFVDAVRRGLSET